jgi:membrane protein YqaA with SNARE-associated domain
MLRPPMATPLSPVPVNPSLAKPSWYRRLYLKVEAMAVTPYALAAMLIISVVDGSFFPIPPFALLVPMVLAKPKDWWKLALYGTGASLVGGLLGYYLGHLIQSGAATMFTIDLNLKVNFFGRHTTVRALLDNLPTLALLSSILPTPFKVVAIGSGMVGVPLSRFMLASLIGRTVRFFLVAGVMAYAGPKARKWLRV